MRTLYQDIRYGFRMLVRNPGFTTIVVLVLALGIGINTVFFSVIDTALLRPLPFERPDEIVTVWQSNLTRGWPVVNVSSGAFLEWKEQNKVFEYIAGFKGMSMTLTGAGEPTRIQAGRVSQSFFPLLDIQPSLGRNFLPEEDTTGAQRVAMLSHGLWQRRFGSDSSVIGRVLTLNGNSFAVIGVLPSDFKFPLLKDAELWVPMAFTAKERDDHGGHWLQVIARLKPGVTVGQADTQMDAIARQLEQEYPDTNKGWGGVFICPLHELIVWGADKILSIMFGVVGCVLLIACANVAGLLLARAPSRQRELAIRAALGARSSQLIRQLLTESLLLALLGGGLGLVWSVWGIRLVTSLLPANFPRVHEMGIDGRVFGFAALVSLVIRVLFGLVPAFRSSRATASESLKEGGPRATGALRSQRLRAVLTVVEMAAALVLLVGAGLLLRSFVGLVRTPRGFRPEGLVTMRISLPGSKYAEDHQVTAFLVQLLRRIERLPTVQSVAAVSFLPTKPGTRWGFTVEDRLLTEDKKGPIASYRRISPKYFHAMGTPLLNGRYFGEHDVEGRPYVAIINEKMAREYWPDGDPIGKRIKRGGKNSQSPWLTIVGIVGNLNDPLKGSENEVYCPYTQDPPRGVNLVVRTSHDPLDPVHSIKTQVFDLDPDLPVSDVATMRGILSGNLTFFRFITILPGVFASLASLLAATGLYGIIAYSVSQRTHEIGIRMALGASSGDVLKMVLRQGLKLVLIGVAIGLAGAFVLTRVISSFLYNVSPTDPLTFVCVSLLLAGVALLASYIPARRAARIDPMVALRYE